MDNKNWGNPKKHTVLYRLLRQKRTEEGYSPHLSLLIRALHTKPMPDFVGCSSWPVKDTWLKRGEKKLSLHSSTGSGCNYHNFSRAAIHSQTADLSQCVISHNTRTKKYRSVEEKKFKDIAEVVRTQY